MDALSTKLTRIVDSATDVTDEFDSINDERDKLLLEMTEYIKEWKAR